MILSENLKNVYSDIRGDIYMHALELEKMGHKVLKLNTGNPAAFGFEMPESIKERIAKDAERALGYCDIKGIMEARIAIRDYHLSRGINNVTEDDIFIGNGVSESAYMVITALIGMGDEVLVPHHAILCGQILHILPVEMSISINVMKIMDGNRILKV